MSDPLASGAASTSAVRAEVARLREFFAQQRPAVGRKLAPVGLEPEAPELVRVFWETFGWADDLARHAYLAHPDVASGREKVQELLAEMREAEVELQAELPQRYRLVHIDQGGLGFAVTDEDGGEPDPPVVYVVSDTGEVLRERTSYLTFCANQLLFTSFTAWPKLLMRLSSYEFLAAAEAPWPRLSPATRRLAPDLWLVPSIPFAVEPGRGCWVAYLGWEELTRWLMAIPEGQAVSVNGLPGKLARVDSLAVAEALLDPGARSFPGLQPDERFVVGTIEGRPVMARQDGEYCWMSTMARDSALLAEKLGREPKPVESPPAPPPVTRTPRPPVRDEDIVALDDLLAELVPQHRATKKAVELEPDAPEVMRRLWSVLGDSHATAGYRPLRREESRATVAQVFADWYVEPFSRFAWSVEGGPEAYGGALPARYRLAYASTDPSDYTDEITFTDEMEAGDDPPVLVMRKTQPPIIPESHSYVEWLVWSLLSRVTWSRRAAYDKKRSGIQGERILPSLYPQIERLGDGVYWMSIFDWLREDEMPAELSGLFYRTLDDYFRWLFALSDEQLLFARAPAARTLLVAPTGAWDLSRGAPDGFRRFGLVNWNGELHPRRWRAIGRINGVFLWLDMSAGEEELTVYLDPRKEAEVREILHAHGLVIKRVGRRLEGYDEYGW